MSVKSCQACAREDGASTPLAVSSVNVKEALPSTQTTESVKVLNIRICFYRAPHSHEHAGNPSLPISCPGMFPWEGNWVHPLRPFCSETLIGWKEKALRAKRQRNIGPCIPTAAQSTSICVCSCSHLLLNQQRSVRTMKQLSRGARLWCGQYIESPLGWARDGEMKDIGGKR